jgi:hypothetical protein
VILPTKPYMPRHKGKVESGVKYVKRNALKGRTFTTQARGVEAVRVLVGLKHLAGKHPSDDLEEACRVALTHGAYRLRTIRQLLKRQGQEQRQFTFLESHPIIRPLSDYSLASLLQFRRERKRNEREIS